MFSELGIIEMFNRTTNIVSVVGLLKHNCSKYNVDFFLNKRPTDFDGH